MGLYRRKSSQFYWMTFKVSGKRIFESTGTANKKLAEKIYAKRFTEIVEGRWFENLTKKYTLKDMIERFEKEYTENKSYYQKARDKSIFKKLHAFFGKEATLQEVEDSIGGYENYRKMKGVKPATIVKELKLLRRMYNVARKQWKWKIKNPVSDIELPKVRNERVRYLNPEEYEKLMTVLDEANEKWLKPLIIIALNTGLRLSNLCDLQRSEVNLFNQMIVISAEKMKNDDYIGIPLTERAYNTFKELLRLQSISGYVFHDNGEKLYPVKVQRAFKKIVEKAGFSNFRFHDLRHTFASYLRQKGVDLHTLSKLLGHKSIRMSERYAHLSVDDLRKAISVLEAGENGYSLVTVDRSKEIVYV